MYKYKIDFTQNHVQRLHYRLCVIWKRSQPVVIVVTQDISTDLIVALFFLKKNCSVMLTNIQTKHVHANVFIIWTHTALTQEGSK
jgi:hypothetical protein